MDYFEEEKLYLFFKHKTANPVLCCRADFLFFFSVCQFYFLCRFPLRAFAVWLHQFCAIALDFFSCSFVVFMFLDCLDFHCGLIFHTDLESCNFLLSFGKAEKSFFHC